MPSVTTSLLEFSSQVEFTSMFSFVEEIIPFVEANMISKETSELYLTFTNKLIMTEFFVIKDFKENIITKVVNFEFSGVVGRPFWFLATIFVSWSFPFFLTQGELNVRIHLGDEVSFVSKMSLEYVNSNVTFVYHL